MSSQNPSQSNGVAHHKRRKKHGFYGGLFIGGVLGVLLAVTVGAFAHFDGPRSGRFGAFEPRLSGERAEFAVDFVLSQVDASEAQREQIKSIVQAAIDDLQPVMDEHGSTHEALHEILAQPNVDRVALEQLRVSTLERADTASQRMVQTLAEAAEVLTQAQRVELLALRERFRH